MVHHPVSAITAPAPVPQRPHSSRGGRLLSSETRLVLATAGTIEPGGFAAQTRKGLDWDRVLMVTLSERAAPAVHAALVRYGGGAAPPAVLDRLARASRGAQLRLAYMTQRLAETNRALSAAGIPVLLLKGAAVARVAYRSLAERPMSDLDLLVPPEHVATAYQLALAAGWRASEYVTIEEFYRGHYHLPPLRDQRMPDVALEIHRDILPEGHPFAFGATDMWRHAIGAGSDDAVVPCAGHQALHLCLHFAWSHMLAQGGWRAFSDLAHLVRANQLQWPELVREAAEHHATASCYWTLRLARDLGGVQVPAEVLEQLQPRRSAMAREFLARHLVTVLDPLGSSCPSTRLKRALLLSALADDVRDCAYRPPWDREHLFVLPTAAPWKPRRQHFRRHLVRAELYLRWGLSLLTGRPVKSQLPVGADDTTQDGPAGEPPTRTSPGLDPAASTVTPPDPSSK